MKRTHFYSILAPVFVLTILVGLSAVAIERLSYPEFDKRHYLDAAQIVFVRPGLKLEIKGVQVNPDRSLSLTFSVADDKGLPLDLNGIATPGVINVRTVLAYIPADQDQYVTLTRRAVTNSPAGVTSQPYYDATTGLKIDKISDGLYRYNFITKLPENDDPNATHSIAVRATRNLSDFDLPTQVANEVVHFLPSGGEVKKVRDVVRTETCNSHCHDPLQIHGGGWRKVEACVLCHNPGNTYSRDGKSLDYKVYIHKIHMGENLPTVEAGVPYRFGNNDFSTVALPQDIRNCVCHTDSKATQKDAWLQRPSRAACGSCHDDVDFASGDGHAGGPQVSDNLCSTCHIPEGELEFDASIKGAHTVPYKSKQLAGINVKILEVTNTAPGQKPIVRYTLQNNAGQPILPSDLNSFSLTLAGPTTDYNTRTSEDPRADSVALPDGSYSYQFKAGIPEDAKGTYAVGTHGYRNVKLNPGTTKEVDYRETAQNHSVTYAAVTDTAPVKRRTAVLREKCNQCHDNLSLHGGTRHDPEYCVMCHQPGRTGRSPDQGPGNSIHFKFMIHRIHTGEDLTRDFTIASANFNEVRFPGDRRNCAKCHEGNSYEVPTKGILATTAPREFYSPIPPNSAACLGCHDSIDAAAHTYAMTTPFGESCGACHGAGAEFAVAKVHAR